MTDKVRNRVRAAQAGQAAPVLWFDYASLDDPNFKEDAVREEIVHPLLLRLGYASTGENRIIRSKTLSHPFVTIGSSQRPIEIIPDYLLSVDGKYRWVLDAKAPIESILAGSKHVEQAYSYAIHPEIRARLFALCNGGEFCLYEVESRDPLMHFPMQEIGANWQGLNAFLSPSAFKRATQRTLPRPSAELPLDYKAIRPPSEVTKFQKQTAKRHHGVHGYFTRQVWSVVQKYISTFSKPGDVVLDPFGGSGVTFLESMILGRKAIQVDINPLSKFLVQTLVTGVDVDRLTSDFEAVLNEFEKRRPATDQDIAKTLSRCPYPKNGNYVSCKPAQSSRA